MQSYLDIVHQVFDRQIVDINNTPCGKVDDLEVEVSAGNELKVTAILMGSTVASDRLPALPKFLVQKMFPQKRIRVPWSEVSVITETIKLKTQASDLGLDESESVAFKIISALPGAWKK